ncbi:MAG TPA: DUF6580 family putative transport protein [Bacteroidia bacterium]|nr:DUF6580 family putative transport protein [Bacteroidia bacterium]
MNKSPILSSRNKFLLGLMLLAALTRLFPHPFNFTPIGAIALFGGVYLRDRRLSILLPMAILFLSDILLQITFGNGFYKDMIFVYGSFALIAFGGSILRGHEQRQTIMVASLCSSILFFLVTNFGVWFSYNTYPATFQGLVSCYVAGIPFFKGTVMGDLFYNLTLFGTYFIVSRRFPSLVKVS